MRLALFISIFLVAAVSSAADPPKSWRFGTGATPEVAVDNIAGSIAVEVGAPGEVRVEATITGGDESDRARWVIDTQADANAVKVKARCKESSCRARVELRVKAPAGSRLALQGISSDISATGINGAQRIQTTSGDVKVTGARELNLKTISGDLKVEGASGVTAETVSGEVTLRSASGQIKAHTVSGDVEWQGTCGAGCRLEVNTVSGDLVVKAAAASSFDLDFQTRSGDFSDGFGTGARGSREGVKAKVGKGEGGVAFRSVSGDLKLQKM